VAVIGAPGAIVTTPAANPTSTAPAGTPVSSAPANHAPAETRPAASSEELARERSSPLVRKIAKEHNVDISQIHGSGIAGRVTKHDILDYLEDEGRTGQAAHAVHAQPGDRVEKVSVMRKKIAEHMVLSRRTSAHVHTVFEVNFSHIARIRDARRVEYERAGGKLTYLAFIIKAVAAALQAVPLLNSSLDGDSVIYHKDINIGVAVALDWGLIVPVVKHADTKDLPTLSRAISDLAARARTKQLSPDEVSGGTFTITNPGMLGAQFGMPIINQPQVAILAVGAIEKRPAVVDDAVAVQTMAYLALGFDHRIIDGAVADTFMSRVKHALEHWDSDQA
jgi:2-oxoglutarate dehydrogenase E2 component (dihydrolipoamide succinyltransferase)